MTAIVIDSAEVTDFLKDFPEQLFSNAKREFSRSVFNVQSNITRPMRSGMKGLQSRSGNLARSIQAFVEGDKLDKLTGFVNTDSIYAPIHETGGTITAKNAYLNLPGGPYLNIPSSLNKTPAGITRFTAAVAFSQGAYIIPINAPKAKYAVMLDGNPLFWLVSSVNIKPTLGMVQTGEDEIPTLLSNLNQTLLDNM